MTQEMRQESSAGQAVSPTAVRVTWGRKWLTPQALGELCVGAVLELDAAVEDEVEIGADGRTLALGEPVIVNGKLAVRVKEVLVAPRADAACRPAQREHQPMSAGDKR